jgi:hypothetical protein
MKVIVHVAHVFSNNGAQQEAAKSWNWINGEIHMPK